MLITYITRSSHNTLFLWCRFIFRDFSSPQGRLHRNGKKNGFCKGLMRAWQCGAIFVWGLVVGVREGGFMAEIAIKYNFCGGDQFCGVCGAHTHTELGPDLFLEGSEQIVCLECGRDYVPQLVALVELGKKAINFSYRCSA